MKKTVTIIIGNTDNRLTQQDWARFVQRVEGVVHAVEASVEFFGGCSSWAQYQNAAWVVVLSESTTFKTLKGMLALLAAEFGQNSIAIVGGETEFVKAQHS